MKRLLAITALLALAIDASAAAAKTAAKKKAAPPPPAVKPLVIPKDATPNPDGTYSWADKSGKKYIFTKTPFGISRREDMAASGTPVFATLPKENFMKAADHGDTVAFERQTPFGTTKWEKKKTELTDEERRVLERQTPKPDQKPE